MMISIGKSQIWFLIVLVACVFMACGDNRPIEINRSVEPWAYRSVLDKKPRMLTLALDSMNYLAYDLSTCLLYKAWKGGVHKVGIAYTSQKNVQPSSWGAPYFEDSLQHQKWNIESNGGAVITRVINRGYEFKDNQIYLNFSLITSSGDSIYIEERPEYIRDKPGKIGLERWFKTSNVPNGFTIILENGEDSFTLKTNTTTIKLDYFDILPEQSPPELKGSYDHIGKYFMEVSDCFNCHEITEQSIGPSFMEIALRYPENEEIQTKLGEKVRNGGGGVWGATQMTPHKELDDDEIEDMISYIFTLKPEDETNLPANRSARRKEKVKEYIGKPLEAVHPSYDLKTLSTAGFNPRVGGLATFDTNRLLVSTWGGNVYLLNGVDDASKMRVKQIASGLAEPLGIKVVDGEIYVLQKQELTRLVDLNNDDIIDKYEVVCDSWDATIDFHEFAYGLEYDNGYFYITLGMAMRLMSNQKEKFDRGRTLKISLKDGSYSWINYGLRQPNGIGYGVNGDLFTVDNQGQWVPANKLIHIKEGDYHGQAWGLLDSASIANPPKMSPPALWLPHEEIGMSPSQPTLIEDGGPYDGQMLHGDQTAGGIRRDYLEKVAGEYQGAVFRFSQGFEAGVNRLEWSPDKKTLYVGQIGMKGGGWGWNSMERGLQSLKYNGKSTFEMRSIKAKPNGFEIEFTQPVENIQKLSASDIFLQQWWYLPTKNYGGPKMDVENLKASLIKISDDGAKVQLEIPNLKENHVVYFKLPEHLKSTSGQSLWSTEAWYTLNNIPEQ